MLPRTKFSDNAVCRTSQFLRRDMMGYEQSTFMNSIEQHQIAWTSTLLLLVSSACQTANRAPVEWPQGFRASSVATCPLKKSGHACFRHHPARPNRLCGHLPNKLLTMSFQTCCAGVCTCVHRIGTLCSLTRYKAFCLLSIWRFFCLKCQNLYPATNAWSCNFCADL